MASVAVTGRRVRGALTVKATTDRSLRITWADGKTSVQVMFYPKGDGKCQVVADHSKLKDAKAAARMKAYWAKRKAEAARGKGKASK